MRKVIYLFLLMTPYLSMGQSKVSFDVSCGAMFSGFGDAWGKNIELELKYNLKYLSVGVNLGMGSTVSSRFGEEYLKETKNLFILDRWTSNYPDAYIPKAFDFGFMNTSVFTNFTNYEFLRLEAGKNIKLSNFLILDLFTFFGIEKVNATYISPVLPVIAIPELGGEEWIATAPLLLNYVGYTYGLKLSLQSKINNSLYLGPSFNISTGPDITWYSVNLKLKLYI